jgi:hypothetical protein
MESSFLSEVDNTSILRTGAPLDIPGAASVTLGLFATVFGITDRSLLVLAVGLILFVLFFQIERRTAAPLVAIHMLKRPSVRWGNLAALRSSSS